MDLHSKLSFIFQIYGSTQFFFSKDQLQALHTSSGMDDDGHVVMHLTACVNSTGKICIIILHMHFSCIFKSQTILLYHLLSSKDLKSTKLLKSIL